MRQFQFLAAGRFPFHHFKHWGVSITVEITALRANISDASSSPMLTSTGIANWTFFACANIGVLCFRCSEIVGISESPHREWAVLFPLGCRQTGGEWILQSRVLGLKVVLLFLLDCPA